MDVVSVLILTSKIVGAAATALGGIFMIWQKAVKPTVKFFRDVKATNELVQKELTANGGSSLRDMVARIDLRLTANEARDQVILQHMDMPIWESDIEGYTTFVTRKLCRLISRSQEEMIGSGWHNVVHPNDRTRVIKEWNAAVKEKREFVMEYSYMSPDGAEIPVRAEAFVLRNSSGEAIGYIGAAFPLNKNHPQA